MADEFLDFLTEQDALDAAQGGAFNDFTQGSGIADFFKNLGLLGGLAQGAGGSAAINSAYNRLGSIGEAAQQGALGIAQEGLEQSKFQPFTVTSSTGGQFGYDPVTGSATMGLSPQEQAIQQAMLSQSQGYIGQPAGSQALTQAGQQAVGMGGSMLGADAFGVPQAQDASGQAYGLGGDFMGRAGMSTAAREADVYDRIRAVQSPEEQRQQLMLEERLSNQGRLGVRSAMFGGTPEQFALSQAQTEAQNRAALSAIQQAQTEQAQAGQLGQAFTTLGGQQSALGQQLGQAGQTQALQMLQAGQGLLGGGLGLDTAQQQLAQGALAGAYVPQAQLANIQQAAQLYPQLQQRGQLSGAGLYGEAAMGGLEALLGSGLGQANLMGQLGTGLLGGLATPTDSYGGLGEVFGGAIEGIGGLLGNIFG